LLEDLYVDWSFFSAGAVDQTYLSMCRALADHYFTQKCYEDAARWTTAVLKEDRCDETAHRQLIQIYAAQGRRSEALQQYQHCDVYCAMNLGYSHCLKQRTSFNPFSQETLIFQGPCYIVTYVP